MKKISLIFGVTGQDGSYLTKLLLKKGYIVHGVKRRSSSINTHRVDDIYQEPFTNKKNFILHYGDMTDGTSIFDLVNKIKPDEIYNLAAQSHVAVSFKNPHYSTEVSTSGPVTLLETVRNLDKEIRYYQASSSEMYGGISADPLDENSLFIPKSPYAVGKLFAHNMTTVYRESYNKFCVNGILFNHESPHRGETFVTRKISRGVGRIFHKIQNNLTLGNMEAFRDWGFAGDYVKGMWMMMQHEDPDDWVLATGETHTVREFAEEAFKIVGLNYEEFVEISEKYFRPNEVDHLLGDYSKAEKSLGWTPKTSFSELVKMMVEHDIEEAQREKVLIDNNLLNPTWENPS